MKFHTIFAASILVLTAAGMLFAAADFVPAPSIDKYLTPENITKLEAGEVVKERTMTKAADGSDSGRAVALILIHAGKDKIMATIHDFPSYPSWMPSTKMTKVLKDEPGRTDVEFELSIMGMAQVKYTTIHKINAEAGTIQWRLDDSKEKKNVKDSVGAWVIKPLAADKCVVAYTISVDTGVSVPGFIQNWLSNKSVVEVTRAVRKRVEGK